MTSKPMAVNFAKPRRLRQRGVLGLTRDVNLRHVFSSHRAAQQHHAAERES